ncbi:unnamed protein product [Arabidopsis lyrata]|nr:unnamed protein product [Arabidopsis lyrata]
MFMDFVNRVLGLQGNSIVNKFSLKCGIDVDPVCVISWILNVLERGLSDLDLRVSVDRGELPSKVFMQDPIMSAAATTRHTSWIVATAIAAVEARWNYPLRFFNKDVKARLRAIAVTSRPPSSASSSSSSSADLVKDNHPMPKSEASMERVMGLSCFGPTTVRF